MKIEIYKTTDSNNTINKTLTDKKIVDVVLKNECNVLNPTLELKENIVSYNYCYIPQFDRYYFINSFTVINRNINRIALSVDVLETYKNDILNSECVINQAQNYNPYIENNNTYEVVPIADIYNSDISIQKNEITTILVTTGGAY